ncbi:hypothetical protein [Lacipirellula sp.]|uniref:hypothetical protein n=1 Tax=Lacipirellula sp. TaxID=2691419 RepID=UPI003D0DBB45
MPSEHRLLLVVNSARTAATLLLVAAATCLATSGCSKSDYSTVSGGVSLDGKPLDGGAIVFVPETSGPLAYGKVRPDGSYTLQSSGGVEGLKPGNYVVTISYRSGQPSFGMTLAQIQALEKVPISYTTPETSSLHEQVLAGENVIDLKLTSK